MLLHRLQQRGLGLGRRAVDFIRQQDVGEDGAGQELEGLVAGLEDVRPDEVGGHQIGRELDALETQVERRGQRAGEERLGEAGYAFEDDMAARQQRDEGVFDHRLLADDDLLDFLPDFGGTGGEEGVHARAALICISSRATRSHPVGGNPAT